MKNKSLYYVLGGVAVVGIAYSLMKKKNKDVVVNLNPPMEVSEETAVVSTTTTNNPLNSAVSILDKIKEIIAEAKKKSVATPTTTA